MKKINYKKLLLFSIPLIVLLIVGSKYLLSIRKIYKEKIGIEHDLIDNSHGYALGYLDSYINNTWKIQFTKMNSTVHKDFNIKSSDKLLVNPTLIKGEAWIKITQGNLLTSPVQKEILKSGEKTLLDLSQWTNGEIQVWILVSDGNNGTIEVKLEPMNLS